ncbi:acyl-CoA dehydrogenase [Chitinophaga polysaccharea]|uniref:acyl-CoA dehydrogenase family protein n=1 Tax=Chitinophaga polysaccharea TaxID=1293035 RepID=UPI0014550CAF|nr:acyl-CoA dehydrogenase family protein [Chitinophaga polysaccharea]NLR57669.1 acyl-CoA dehydrogenase [Chitinophaga polysaccharea]
MSKNWLEEVKQFTDNYLRPLSADIEENGSVPENIIQGLATMGMLAVTFPREYGGLELDPLTYGYITEEIGKACCATRSLLTVHSSLVGESIVRYGTASQKSYWLPLMANGTVIAAFALSEPGVGSDAAGIQTTYRKRSGGYLISGRKKWITFGTRADLFLVMATGSEGITAFLVEKNSPGLNVTPMKGMMAGRAAAMAELEFTEVAVADQQVLGKTGNGFRYIVNTALDHGRYSVAWGGLAIAQEALESMVSYARKRKQFGKALYEYQLIQGLIGDAVAQVHAARSLCIHAGTCRKENHPDMTGATQIAKYFASVTAVKVAADAVQVHGANGCNSIYPVERLFREAKVLEIIEGSSQIQQVQLSELALSRYYRNGYYVNE